MNQINSHTLLAGLAADVQAMIHRAEELHRLPPELLSTPPAPGKWSVAEILAHLNIYAEYYLPAIEKKLQTARKLPDPIFKPGWLGNYFTRMMKPMPDNTVPHKMKTFKNAIPPQDIDAEAALNSFLRHSDSLLNLLKRSKRVNLNAIRIPISISKLVTLKLGDTFRFFIAHEQRHFLQIKNTLSQLNKTVYPEYPEHR